MKSEREVQYGITDTWNLKYDTNKQTDRENRLVVDTGENRWERDGLGVWDELMQTITCKMNKQ